MRAQKVFSTSLPEISAFVDNVMLKSFESEKKLNLKLVKELHLLFRRMISCLKLNSIEDQNQVLDMSLKLLQKFEGRERAKLLEFLFSTLNLSQIISQQDQ